MSDIKGLIERMCLAVHGETPEYVLEVLPIFVAVVCEKYSMSIEDFVEALRAATSGPWALSGTLAPKAPPD